MEENKRKLEKRKGNDGEDEENVDDYEDEWASSIKDEQSRRHVALRLQQYWIAQKQQREVREQNVECSEKDKDTENNDMGFSDVEVEEARQETVLGQFVVSNTLQANDCSETADMMTGDIYTPE